MGPILRLIILILSTSVELWLVVLKTRMIWLLLMRLSVSWVWMVSVVRTGVVWEFRTAIIDSTWNTMMARKSNMSIARMDWYTAIKCRLYRRWVFHVLVFISKLVLLNLLLHLLLSWIFGVHNCVVRILIILILVKSWWSLCILILILINYWLLLNKLGWLSFSDLLKCLRLLLHSCDHLLGLQRFDMSIVLRNTNVSLILICLSYVIGII